MAKPKRTRANAKRTAAQESLSKLWEDHVRHEFLVDDVTVIVSSVITSVLLDHDRGAPQAQSAVDLFEPRYKRRVIKTNVTPMPASGRGRPTFPVKQDVSSLERGH